MKYINTVKAPKAIGPYSQAVVVNDLLYVSGQIPIDPETGELVEGGISAETKRVMQNLQAILEEAGTSFDRVIKASIFLKDMNDFSVVNEIYGSYLTEGKFPARETVQVSKLPKDVQIEISVIAQV